MHTISRNKGNQTKKFAHLVEYNLRNIFVEKSYTKCGGEAIFTHFSKKSKLRLSLNQWSKFLCNLFIWHTNLRAIEIKRNETADHLLVPYIKLF